jgi:sulfite dehydrogenase (cytochrome) subunit B
MMSPFARHFGVCALALMSGGAAADGKVSIQPPAETAVLKPGPGQDVAQANCFSCHSVDYIYMQPPMTEAQWRAVVVKMKKVMGAPIADEDVDVIVKYLVSQNGKKE